MSVMKSVAMADYPVFMNVASSSRLEMGDDSALGRELLLLAFWRVTDDYGQPCFSWLPPIGGLAEDDQLQIHQEVARVCAAIYGDFVGYYELSEIFSRNTDVLVEDLADRYGLRPQ